MSTIIHIDGQTNEGDIRKADRVIKIFGNDFVYLKDRHNTSGCAHVYSLQDLPMHIIANEGIKQKPPTKFDATWGTYGKLGTDPLTFKRLIDLESDHLQAIARTQPISIEYRKIIVEILQDRKVLP